MAKQKSFIRKIVSIILFSILIFAIAAIIVFFFIWESETINKKQLSELSETAVFYDTNGDSIKNPDTRQYHKIDTLNKNTLNAFISVEDKNFYSHNGLSYPRIAKALLNNIVAGYSKEGASTISQQLIKNTHLTNEKTLKRKIREAILALKLEQNYTKDEILELYLNAIYFGNNIYGIGNASEYYYNKPVAELNAIQSAGLAAIIKSPQKYDPISNYENFKARANLILNLMHEQNYLTDEEYEEAKNAPLEIKLQEDIWIGRTYQDAAIKQASQILNLSESDIINYGYQIETYYNPEKQQLIYDAINQNEYNLPGDKFIMLSSPNGQTSALWTSNPLLISAKRNFGSVMKPLLVYAPALELGIIQPESTIDDSPLIDSEFNPKNAGDKYNGKVSVRESLSRSLNIPAVKIMSATTVKKSTEIAKKFGLDLGEENLSASLGNTINGTSFFELATGYQTIANQGKYSPVRFIRSIRDRNGQIVYFDLTNKYNYSSQVITQDTAYLLTDMLLDTSKTGTGRKLSYLKTDIASKTGTTERTDANSNTDATFVSYTPNDVLVAWIGNSDMKPENDLPAGTVGGGKLGYAVKQVHSSISKPDIKFIRPSSIKEIKLDALDYNKSELNLASPLTPEEETVLGLFASKYAPTQVSQNYLITTPPEIDGKVGDNNVPIIWFNTLKHQSYEIYKNDRLQEVITGKNGQYIFTDKHPNKINTYRVNASINGDCIRISNEIILYSSSNNNKEVKQIERKKIPWYF